MGVAIMPGKATQSMAALAQTIEELQRNQKELVDNLKSQSDKLSIIERDVQMVTVERFAVIIHSFTSDIIPLLRKEFDDSVKKHYTIFLNCVIQLIGKENMML